MECFNLHTHHGYKHYSTSPLKQITENGGTELLISEEASLTTLVPHTKCHASFYRFSSCFLIWNTIRLTPNSQFIFVLGCCPTIIRSIQYHGIYYTNTISNQIT